jgi:hypothetical protein
MARYKQDGKLYDRTNYRSLVAISPLYLIYAHEEEGMVSQNTTVIFEEAFYLG